MAFARRATSAWGCESLDASASRSVSSLRTAPPCDRTARFWEQSASRSPRAVTAETENRWANSRTVICPFCSMSSNILRLRCSDNRRESRDAMLVFLAGAGNLPPVDLILYSQPEQNKRKLTLGSASKQWLLEIIEMLVVADATS